MLLATVKRWVDRYLAGDRRMLDHSSRPHTMPAKTEPSVTKRLVSLRLRLREGPVQLAAHCGIALDRAPDPGAVPAQPAGPRRPGHR